MNYDLVIKNGLVVEGTGNSWYKADMGVVPRAHNKYYILLSRIEFKV